ncbi:ADP-ribosylation factor-like protein 13A [Pseudopipra pipra]|uniref:ADP-ribosylation factor-like protein 13A n=1 Tax=Pseudopipra pipra TaxID=415032 RepID=UPI0031390A9F
MFHLFSHCWSWLQAIQEPIRKVTLLVVGLDNAGKTSVITDIEKGEELHQSRPQLEAAALSSFATNVQGTGCAAGSSGSGSRDVAGRRGGTCRREAPGFLCQLSALSPHTALAGEVLPDAQPGQTRLRVDRFEVTLVDLPGGQRSRSSWRSHYSGAHGLLFVLDSSDLARMEEARKVLSRVLSHPDISGKPLLLLANKQDAAAALLPCEVIERLCLERLVNENRSPCRIVSAGLAPLPAPSPCGAALPGLTPRLPAGALCRQAGPPRRPGPCHPAGAALAPPRCRRSGPAARRTRTARPEGRPRPPARPQVHKGLRGCVSPSPSSSPQRSTSTPSCSRPRDRPPPGEDAREGAGNNGDNRPLRPVCHLLPLEESTKGTRRRKKKVKVKKKVLGQPSPAEEPEGPGEGGDRHAGAAGGLLLPNRVGQEEPVPTRMATPHPGERGLWEAASTAGTSISGAPEPPYR